MWVGRGEEQVAKVVKVGLLKVTFEQRERRQMSDACGDQEEHSRKGKQPMQRP